MVRADCRMGHETHGAGASTQHSKLHLHLHLIVVELCLFRRNLLLVEYVLRVIDLT
jgi:hypothetical protein